MHVIEVTYLIHGTEYVILSLGTDIKTVNLNFSYVKSYPSYLS